MQPDSLDQKSTLRGLKCDEQPYFGPGGLCAPPMMAFASVLLQAVCIILRVFFCFLGPVFGHGRLDQPWSIYYIINAKNIDFHETKEEYFRD